MKVLFTDNQEYETDDDGQDEMYILGVDGNDRPLKSLVGDYPTFLRHIRSGRIHFIGVKHTNDRNLKAIYPVSQIKRIKP